MRLMTAQWLAVVALIGFTFGCTPRHLQPPYQKQQQTRQKQQVQQKQQAKQPQQTPPARTASRLQNASKPIGMLVEPEPAATIGYRLGWASPIELLPGQAITSVTVLDDMVLIIEDPRNTVTALDANDGKLLWKIVLGSDIESLFAPTRDGQQIFIHSSSRLATVDARNGKVTAYATLETPVSAKGIYSPEHRIVIMSGTNGLVYGHSVDTNFARWRYRLASRMTSPCVLVGQDVFAVDSGGTYAMVEAATGLPLWRNRTLGPVTTTPTFKGTEVIVASQDGKLYALNRTTGRDTWKYLGAEQKLVASPIAMGRLVIQPLLPEPGLVAVDAINGTEIWRADITAEPILTRQKDMLLFNDNELISIDLSDGSVNVKVPTENLQTVLPIGDDDGLLVVSPKGRLLKLSPL